MIDCVCVSGVRLDQLLLSLRRDIVMVHSSRVSALISSVLFTLGFPSLIIWCVLCVFYNKDHCLSVIVTVYCIAHSLSSFQVPLDQ